MATRPVPPGADPACLVFGAPRPCACRSVTRAGEAGTLGAELGDAGARKAALTLAGAWVPRDVGRFVGGGEGGREAGNA